jgi:hypothetical protein
MVNMAADDVPPPGAGFCTVTLTAPAELTSVAEIWAVREVLDTYVVGTWLPFHINCELVMNSVPVTISINAELPALTLAGDSEVMLGVGLGGVFTEKVAALDVPPPGGGFCTVTLTVLAEFTSDAGICAVREVLDTYIVVTAVPFHWMTAPTTKLLPVAVTVNAPLPAMTELGVNPLSIGTGFCWFCVLPCAPPPQPISKQSRKRQSAAKSKQTHSRRILCIVVFPKLQTLLDGVGNPDNCFF